MVKFDPAIVESTAQYGSKEYVMRKRLSRHQRLLLYRERPDLDMSRPLPEPGQESDSEDDTTGMLWTDNITNEKSSTSYGHDAVIRAEMEAQEFGITYEQQSPPTTDGPSDSKLAVMDASGGGLMSPLLDEEHGLGSSEPSDHLRDGLGGGDSERQNEN